MFDEDMARLGPRAQATQQPPGRLARGEKAREHRRVLRDHPPTLAADIMLEADEQNGGAGGIERHGLVP